MNKKLPVAKAKDEITTDFNSKKENGESVYFHLQDSKHEFVMGLHEILKCLQFAEDEGLVPELPADWWLSMNAEYFDLYEQRNPNFTKGYYGGFWAALDFVRKEISKGNNIEEIDKDGKLSSLSASDLIDFLDKRLEEQ